MGRIRLFRIRSGSGSKFFADPDPDPDPDPIVYRIQVNIFKNQMQGRSQDFGSGGQHGPIYQILSL